MTDHPIVGYYALPSRAERFWHLLGFRMCNAPRPDEDEYAEGFFPSWFIVETFAKLDWKDRLRSLVSGKIMVQVAVKTDTQISRSRSTGAISVLRPDHDLR